jgi:hypothetical protein
MSVFAHAGQLYSLHPELVRVHDAGLTAWLCSTCAAYAQASRSHAATAKVPTYSLVAGVDYGVLSRAVPAITTASVLEHIVLGTARVSGNMTTVAPDGTSPVAPGCCEVC